MIRSVIFGQDGDPSEEYRPLVISFFKHSLDLAAIKKQAIVDSKWIFAGGIATCMLY